MENKEMIYITPNEKWVLYKLKADKLWGKIFSIDNMGFLLIAKQTDIKYHFVEVKNALSFLRNIAKAISSDEMNFVLEKLNGSISSSGRKV